MKILALIPARGGSKGIPGKNLKPLGKTPLINHSIHTALNCRYVDSVLVSTDNQEIAAISKATGAMAPFLRPAALATDTSPTIDTVLHALQYMQAQHYQFDAVCLLQPTIPFRSKVELEKAVETFIDSKADSLITVRKVPHKYNPHWCFEPKGNGRRLKIATGESEIISRRQELPEAYYRDGSVYLTRVATLLKEKSLYGNSIAYFENTASPDINLDTLADWDMAEKYIGAREE